MIDQSEEWRDIKKRNLREQGKKYKGCTRGPEEKGKQGKEKMRGKWILIV